MSYNVFLSGGGSAEDTYDFDDLFLKTAGQKILYLPVGLKRTFAGYDDCVKWFSDLINLHASDKNISVWINLKGKDVEIKKENFDAIYIGGASTTLRLHKQFMEFNFYPRLKEFIEAGGIIYGGSGGASILGRFINYDQMESSSERIKDPAADLCLGYSIFAHLNDKNRYLVQEGSEGRVIAIPERCGCAIDIDEGKVVCISGAGALMVSVGSIIALQNGQSYSMLG